MLDKNLNSIRNISPVRSIAPTAKALIAGSMWQLAVVLAAIPSTAQAQDARKDEAVRQLQKSCERLDPVLIGQLNMNYTVAADEAKRLVQLEYIDTEALPFRINFLASYDLKNRTLQLPSTYMHSDSENICGHELWHAFSSKNEEKEEKSGLMHDKRYNGPSLDELNAHAQKKVASPAFDTLRQDLLDAENALLASRAIQRIVSTLSAEQNKYVRDGWNVLREKQKGRIESYGEYLSPEVKEQIEKRFVEVRDTVIRPFDQEYMDAMSEAETFTKAVKTYIDSDSRAISRFILEHREKLDQMQRRMRSSIEAAAAALPTLQKILDEDLNTERLVEKKVADLEAKRGSRLAGMANDTEREDIGKMYETLIDLARSEPAMEDLKYAMRNWGGISYGDGLGEAALDFKTESNSDSIRRVLGDPDEVVARMIDSLYSLHLGPVEQNRFPLYENDLEILEKIEFDGKQMLRIGIEKYRVAQQLERAGMKIEEIRGQLLDASSYTHQGTVYDWSRPDFRIVGNIPTWSIGNRR